MTLPPVPSPDEIVRLYKSGELPAELARYHQTGDGDEKLFLVRCVALHNGGDIDLVGLTSEAAFAELSGHAFFTAQNLYCAAIPNLDANVSSLMECCRILIEQAGSDLAANEPNGAFRTWCRNNPSKGASVVHEAVGDNALAKRFVTFALQAANDIKVAIEFIETYTDDRRLSGMAALSGMAFPDAALAQKAVAALEPFVGDRRSDNLRISALLAAFNVLAQHNDAAVAHRLIESAAKESGPETLYGLARILWLHRTMLDNMMLRVALAALQAVDPAHLGTIREIDMALRPLLGTSDEPSVLDFLTAKLRDNRLKIESFQSVAHELSHGDEQRLYNLTVRWLLSGSIALCSNVSDLVDREHAFDMTAQPLGLPPMQQIFVCRKAIGFLFAKPVICCSIIVSILRAGNQEVAGVAADLLFDPMLTNYGGDAKGYLEGVQPTDTAYGAIQSALERAKIFYSGLDAAGVIKELHPSEYQRNVARQRIHDDMKTAHKQAESQSIFANLFHRSTILYGKRSLTYVEDPDGKRRAVEMDLKPFSASFELPRREVLDPVGLDYMIRVFRAEKFK